jgi:hypothetical protein
VGEVQIEKSREPGGTLSKENKGKREEKCTYN